MHSLLEHLGIGMILASLPAAFMAIGMSPPQNFKLHEGYEWNAFAWLVLFLTLDIIGIILISLSIFAPH